MAGFTGADWFGVMTSNQSPIGQVPKTEGLRAQMDGGNSSGTLSQASANIAAGDRTLLYWQAGLIGVAILILWALGALSA